MVFLASAITFLATVVILMAIAYAVSTVGESVGGRLSRLWHPTATETQRGFREKQKERAQRVLRDVGKLVPASAKTLSRTRGMMIRAGYRRPEAVPAFRGAKMFLIVGLLIAVYVSRLHMQNPIYLVLAITLGFVLPDVWLSRRVKRRQHRIRLGLADALDLLVICVEAGLGLDQSILRVSEELKIAHAELSEELRLVNLDRKSVV